MFLLLGERYKHSMMMILNAQQTNERTDERINEYDHGTPAVAVVDVILCFLFEH